MTSEADAEKVRDRILGYVGSFTDISRNDETLHFVVVKNQVTVYTSAAFTLTDDLPKRIFLPTVYGASFTVYLVYTLYASGRKPVRIYNRIRYRTHPVKTGTFLSFPRVDSDLPVLLPKVRNSARQRQKRNRVRKFIPKKAGRLNPEDRFEVLATMRVRHGIGVDQEVPFVYRNYHRVWSGTTTPGFRLLKKRKLPVNPHSVLLVEQNQPGFYKSDGPAVGPIESWWITPFCDWASLGSPRVSLHSELIRNRAISRVIKRMESGIDGNVAQDVVQIRQTVDTITDVAKRMSNAVRAVRNGNIPGAVEDLWRGRVPRFNPQKPPKHGAGLANNWLALQYGWKPLLEDIRGSMEALARYNLANESVRVVTGSASERLTDYIAINDDYNGQVRVGTLNVFTERKCKIGLKYRVSNHLRTFLSQTGFTNPVNLAWEILPYSFVLDWFLPIGPYLETLSAYDGLEFYEGYETQFTRTSTYGTANFAGLVASGTRRRVYKGEYSSSAVLLDRAKLETFPRMSFPALKNPLSVTHGLNAIALMRSAFRG